MQFEHSFQITGKPADIIELFDDLPLVASFLPGASVGEINEDGSYPGVLTVAFGPKRLTFKGNLRGEVDKPQLSGVISGTANADVRGARMAITLNYHLTPLADDAPDVTVVNMVSDAQLTGVLEQFAKTGGTVVVHAILDEFAKRFSAHCAAGTADGPAAADPSAAAAAATANTESVLSVRMILAGMFRHWMQRLRAALFGRAG